MRQVVLFISFVLVCRWLQQIITKLVAQNNRNLFSRAVESRSPKSVSLSTKSRFLREPHFLERLWEKICFLPLPALGSHQHSLAWSRISTVFKVSIFTPLCAPSSHSTLSVSVSPLPLSYKDTSDCLQGSSFFSSQFLLFGMECL